MHCDGTDASSPTPQEGGTVPARLPSRCLPAPLASVVLHRSCPVSKHRESQYRDMSATHLFQPVPAATPEAAAPPAGRVRRRSVWTVVTGALGAVMGLAPHVLHHIGPLVGTALVTGVGGTALFGALGLAASVPMLLKLRRRFASWWSPTLALIVFTAMFALSSFIIGPQISGESEPAGPVVNNTGDHDLHHE